MLFKFCFCIFSRTPPPANFHFREINDGKKLFKIIIKLVFLDKLHASNTHFIIREIVAIGSIENEPKSRPIVAGTVVGTR